MTLEEAQEKILELQGQVTELTNERDALTADKKDLAENLEKVRSLNQKYFNQLSAQYAPKEEEAEEEVEVEAEEDASKEAEAEEDTPEDPENQ